MSLYFSLLRNSLFARTWPLIFSSGKLGTILLYSYSDSGFVYETKQIPRSYPLLTTLRTE